MSDRTGIIIILIGAAIMLTPFAYRLYRSNQTSCEWVEPPTAINEYIEVERHKVIDGEDCIWIPEGEYRDVTGAVIKNGVPVHLDKLIPAEDGGYWLRPGQVAYKYDCEPKKMTHEDTECDNPSEKQG